MIWAIPIIAFDKTHISLQVILFLLVYSMYIYNIVVKLYIDT